MMKNLRVPSVVGFILLTWLLVPGSLLFSPGVAAGNQEDPTYPKDYQALRSQIITQFPAPQPLHWGENVPGVKTHLVTSEKVIALTFDACGQSPASKGYDTDLIEFLIRQQVPATLFLTTLWIEANPELAAQLAANPLFEIENHGQNHRPSSVTGKAIYGIPGTQNVGEVVDEVELGARKITALTGKRPRFYRSGTAYYDEIAVQVIEALGYHAVNFSVLGDAGATYNRYQVRHALLSAKPGDIVLAHMNHPESDTAEGVVAAVPELKKQGFKFVKLEDVPGLQ